MIRVLKKIISYKGINLSLKKLYCLLDRYSSYIGFSDNKQKIFNSECYRAKPLFGAKIDYNNSTIPDLCIYTCVDEQYELFGILFPIFAIISNPEAIVEVGILDGERFQKKYSSLIKWYNNNYKNNVVFSQIPNLECKAGSLRFIVQPYTCARYVYVGDADIFILENVLEKHLPVLSEYNCDFSNIVRQNSKSKKLSGLHFSKYEKMYPMSIPDFLLKRNIIANILDEELLYILCHDKQIAFPPKTFDYRPICGYHVSYFSRAPFPTLTTEDCIVDFPSWFNVKDNKSLAESIRLAKIYKKKRYSDILKNFFSCIDETQIELRRIIQIADICNEYFLIKYDEKKVNYAE